MRNESFPVPFNARNIIPTTMRSDLVRLENLYIYIYICFIISFLSHTVVFVEFLLFGGVYFAFSDKFIIILYTVHLVVICARHIPKKKKKTASLFHSHFYSFSLSLALSLARSLSLSLDPSLGFRSSMCFSHAQCTLRNFCICIYIYVWGHSVHTSK